MNTNNGFDILVYVSFNISPQPEVIGPKPSDIITSLNLQPCKTTPDLHICTLRVHIKIILMKYETFHKISLTWEYICEISKLLTLHQYMTIYEI